MQKYRKKLILQNIMWKNIKGRGYKKAGTGNIKEPVPECESVIGWNQLGTGSAR